MAKQRRKNFGKGVATVDVFARVAKDVVEEFDALLELEERPPSRASQVEWLIRQWVQQNRYKLKEAGK